MPKLVTWMNNERVGELTKLTNGAHTFKYAREWLFNRHARPCAPPLTSTTPALKDNVSA
jgi:serine/threonine-protein kinase HipA